jgi:hypothetical protein
MISLSELFSRLFQVREHIWLELFQVSDGAFKTFKRFRLGGFLILKSSKDSYQVVFNHAVSWTVNVGIVAWVLRARIQHRNWRKS